MKVFRDALGREWSFALNVGAMKRVRDLVGIDLLQTAEALEKIMDDPVALGQILFCLCKKQAEERGISEEQFLEGLVGEALDSALDNFMKEWVDFFPRSQRLKRLAIEKTLELRPQYEAIALAKAEEELQKLQDSSRVQEMIDNELKKTRGESSSS